MYRRGLLLLAAGLWLAGCEDSSSPEGSSSSVTVRAFIDADGSGSFNAGDVPLPGRPITLQATSGSASFTASTDAQGVASFTAVPPGSYQATLGGAAAAGAVLATAAAPVIVTSFGGGTAAAEFRYVYLPGNIAGVLYRDENGNGVYDAGTDTPAPGLPVALFAAAGTQPLASTTTSAGGAFAFSTLRPGAYRVVVTPLPTMQIVGGDTMAVTVGPQTPLALPVRFTGNLISTVASVRTQPKDASVAFQGVVTVSPNVLSTSASGQQVYVQDASGAGVLVFFGSTPTAGITQGDSVRVVGTIDFFSGELEVVRPTVTRLGTGTVPAPRQVTGRQLMATTVTSGLQGVLVTVAGARVTAVSGTATSTAYNVTVQAGDTSFVVRVSSANVGIPQTFWQVGASYDVTGIVSAFNGVPQLKLRSAADARAVSAPLSIAAARTKALGDTVLVQGVVTVAPGTFRLQGDNLFLQDATGGLQVFNVPTGTVAPLGTMISVRGLLGANGGELQIVRFSTTSPPVITVLGTAPVPAPRVLTAAEFAARTYEGQLAKVNDIEVVSVGSVSGTTGSYNITAKFADGTPITVRVQSSAVGIPSTTWVAGTRYDVTGVLGSFNGVPQIYPRSATDVVQH